MADVTRMGVEDAYHDVLAGQALLVCAYEDEAKCRQIALKGSIPLTQLGRRCSAIEWGIPLNGTFPLGGGG